MRNKYDVIPLRPHHALCLQFFVGKGYGDAFVSGMSSVESLLRERPEQPVVLTDEADGICAACPNRRSESCRSKEKVARYDRDCLQAYGLRVGRTIPWRDLKDIALRSVILTGKRSKICFDCQWNKICSAEEEKYKK